MASIQKAQVVSQLDGTVAIEFGLILPVLLLFTLGIIDFGRFLWTDTTLTRATEAAARCGALNATTSTICPNIAAYAVAQAWGISGITASAFTGTPAATCGGQAGASYQVSASYNFQFIVPWFPQYGGSSLGTVTLTPSACYPQQ
jgi:Flp pilus assembly protein TadG